MRYLERRENNETKQLRYNRNDSRSNNDNKEIRVLNNKLLGTLQCLVLNEITFQQNCLFRKSTIRGAPPLRAVCTSFPRGAKTGRRLRHTIDYAGGS